MTTRTCTPGTTGLMMEEPTVFEIGSPGRTGYSFAPLDVPEVDPAEELGAEFVREEVSHFPELTEVDVMRHFLRLSQWNYCIDTGFYPLGSCTMKYNPKINEDMARLPEFTKTHPKLPDELVQGNLQMMHCLESILAEISGMDAVTLQPAAGAHGELTGLMLIRAYHVHKGQPRKKILVPDSAHGTNPASAALCGFKTVEIKSGPDGIVLPETIAEAMDEDVAGVMMTNPNTLGLFETHIKEICDIVHDKGGLVYCDGANLNAILGVVRPGDMGFDVLHFNLHKTFSTPHGGGGPGAGPVGVKSVLEPFLPSPVIVSDEGKLRFDHERPLSIGKVKGFWGNFGVLVRAYSYLMEMGRDNLRRIAESAVLNANYLRASLVDDYHLPYPGTCMHEVVFSDKRQHTQNGVNNLDISKRLIDLGFHPPTMSFPLIVHGALMIEPTDTESLETLDSFVEAMKQVAEECRTSPEVLHDAPVRPVRRRFDEATAARRPILRWSPSEEE